ncbi:uncharacterized protein LY79DRAFT_399323 [Colletotrichum navitas]|uniref:Uncharacterized protein n=1 Tax=Colletotrichum navitas TaxID=681940 RepID=A0AAD8PPE6_9PEZI|nr:uncharacterized protein LY79DRAFT_399323 [Colletotrichum navitas]KAK1573782.1 hypothetical protein LY79DRAFT_399323 [Colletotrichum navitas]
MSMLFFTASNPWQIFFPSGGPRTIMLGFFFLLLSYPAYCLLAQRLAQPKEATRHCQTWPIRPSHPVLPRHLSLSLDILAGTSSTCLLHTPPSPPPPSRYGPSTLVALPFSMVLPPLGGSPQFRSWDTVRSRMTAADCSSISIGFHLPRPREA